MTVTIHERPHQIIADIVKARLDIQGREVGRFWVRRPLNALKLILLNRIPVFIFRMLLKCKAVLTWI